MHDEAPMGEVLREGGRIGLRYTRELAHPPEKVWRALTESRHLRHWLPCDIAGERAAGAAIELPFWPDHVERYEIAEPTLHGHIRVWSPPEVFEWTWETDVLRWELRPVGEGTVLVFTTWLADPDPAGASEVAAGYHACLEQLVELLDTGTVAVRLVDADGSALQQRYAALVPTGSDATA